MAAMGCLLKCLSKGYSMSVEDKRGGWAKPTLFFYFLLITEMPDYVIGWWGHQPIRK
jgi:hypothetical protein